MAIGELGRILVILKEKLCVPNDDDQQLGLSQEAWPQLQTAVQDSGDEELIRQLEVHTQWCEITSCNGCGLSPQNLKRDLITSRKLSE